MKKINFLFIILILSACTPQVIESPTVTLAPPTQTPIPTPTLHPEFIALQNLISDSSQRFTLLPDGSIEDNGIAIPNLHVDQNGIIIIIFNDERVVIEQSQITFDDDNGISIQGYTLNENNEWVKSISEGMQTLQTDLKKFNISPTDYIVTETEDGVEVADAEGNFVYRNGSFEPMFLGQMIVNNNMCLRTEWTAAKVGPGFPKDLQSFLRGYADPLTRTYLSFIKNRIIQGTGTMLQPYYLGDGCWGQVQFAKMGQIDAWYLWKNQSGNMQYQRVFLPSVGE